jgi:[acyl-carrier-protein] S-malonyltransferase
MKLAMIFSGQGAQAVGMGRDLAEAYPACRALYEQADAILGAPLSRICFEGPEEALTRSSNCQPAIFVTSMACRAALLEQRPDLQPAALAGLSLGEWSALHAAGVLSFEDTVRVLEARGRFMQEACEANPGGMVSVMGLERDALDAVCAESGMTIANLNNAQQTVLSGPRESVPLAEAAAKAKGAKRAVVLNVAGAFHSPLMASAATRLAEVLAAVNMREPSVPVLSNVTGAVHGNLDAIRENMVKQVTHPVHWLNCVEAMAAMGVDTYVECGPGKVLTGLIRRIDKDAAAHNVEGAESAVATAAAL